MNYLIAKLFYKNSFIKVRIYNIDKRYKVYYLIPKNNIININDGGEEKSFVLNDKNMLLENGIPTYIFNGDVPISLNLLDAERPLIEYSPKQLHDAINSKIIGEMFNSFAKGEKISLGNILSIATFVAVLGVGFLLYTEIGNLKTSIEMIIEFLRNGGI